jgi:hypothetical protein
MLKQQFTLYVENKAGALAKVARLLGNAHINIEGISIAVSGDVGLIQLVVSKATRAAQIFKRAKIPYTVQQVAVIAMRNRPGELAALAEKFAARKINLNYLYATTGMHSEGECAVVVSGDNLKRIEALWRKARGG